MSRVLVGLRGSGIIGHTVPESGIRLNAPAVRPQEEWEKDVLASAKGKGKANGSTTRTGKGGGIPLVCSPNGPHPRAQEDLEIIQKGFLVNEIVQLKIGTTYQSVIRTLCAAMRPS